MPDNRYTPTTRAVIGGHVVALEVLALPACNVDFSARDLLGAWHPPFTYFCRREVHVRNQLHCVRRQRTCGLGCSARPFGRSAIFSTERSDGRPFRF